MLLVGPRIRNSAASGKPIRGCFHSNQAVSNRMAVKPTAGPMMALGVRLIGHQ